MHRTYETNKNRRESGSTVKSAMIWTIYLVTSAINPDASARSSLSRCNDCRKKCSISGDLQVFLGVALRTECTTVNRKSACLCFGRTSSMWVAALIRRRFESDPFKEVEC